ncbi:peptidase inhibitor family I36 protein [Streptomyces albidoflavus]
MGRGKALRTRIGLTAGATLIAGLGLGAVGTPAQAAWVDCDPGALCAYLQTNGGGSPGRVYGDNANLRQYDKFARARSLVNNGTQCNVRLWPHTGLTGQSYVMLRGERISDTERASSANGMFRNGVGSNRWC